MAAGEFGAALDADAARAAVDGVAPPRAYTIPGTLLNMAAATVSSVFDLAFPFGRVVGAQVSLPRALLAVPVVLAVALAAGLWPAVPGRPGAPGPGVGPARRRARPGPPPSAGHPHEDRAPGRPGPGQPAPYRAGHARAGHRRGGTDRAGRDPARLPRRRRRHLARRRRDAAGAPVDLAAVLTTILLGVFAVADVLYLNIRQRATELAALRAMGWSRGALHRLITWEGALIGLLGAGTGSLAGLGAARVLFGHTAGLPTLVPVALVTAATGIALSAAAAAVPALMLDRRPIAPLLAEE